MMVDKRLSPSFRTSSWTNHIQGRVGVGSANRPHQLLRLSGRVSPKALDAAFKQLLELHPILKCGVVDIDGAPGFVERHRPTMSFHSPGSDPHQLASDLIWREFDFANGGELFRGFVVPIAPDDALMGLVTHHFISDAQSVSIMTQDLAALYTASLTRVEPLSSPHRRDYRCFLTEVEEWARNVDGDRAIAFWRGLLGDVSPTWRTQESAEAGTFPIRIDESAHGRFRMIAKGHGVTVFTVLVALQHMTLAGLSDVDRTLITTVVNGRARPGYARSVGYFSDRLHYPLDVSGDPTLGELAKRVWALTIEGQKLGFVPSDILVARGARAPELLAPVFNFLPQGRQPRTGSVDDRQRVASWQPVGALPPPAAPSSPGSTTGGYWLELKEHATGMDGAISLRRGGDLRLIAAIKGALENPPGNGDLRVSQLSALCFDENLAAVAI